MKFWKSFLSSLLLLNQPLYELVYRTFWHVPGSRVINNVGEREKIYPARPYWKARLHQRRLVVSDDWADTGLREVAPEQS